MVEYELILVPFYEAEKHHEVAGAAADQKRKDGHQKGVAQKGGHRPRDDAGQNDRGQQHPPILSDGQGGLDVAIEHQLAEIGAEREVFFVDFAKDEGAQRVDPFVQDQPDEKDEKDDQKIVVKRRSQQKRSLHPEEIDQKPRRARHEKQQDREGGDFADIELDQLFFVVHR